MVEHKAQKVSGAVTTNTCTLLNLTTLLKVVWLGDLKVVQSFCVVMMRQIPWDDVIIQGSQSLCLEKWWCRAIGNSGPDTTDGCLCLAFIAKHHVLHGHGQGIQSIWHLGIHLLYNRDMLDMRGFM